MTAKILSILCIFMLTAGTCRKVIIEHIPVCDSVVVRDSFVTHVSIRDSLIIRDSSLIKDTLKLIEIGDGNMVITGSTQHTTFDIDLDSVGVTIRNDSIINLWFGERPARTE